MARLVVNSGSATPWEIPLSPGETSLGRGPDNDFQIPHPSVSSCHCRIILNDGLAILRDLGSTNGSFVNRLPVQQAELQSGHAVRLGEVEMVYYADEAPAMPLNQAVPAEMDERAAGLRDLARSSSAISPAPSPTWVGPKSCKFHPKMPARLCCPKCHAYYCEACVALRQGGARFCRHCGSHCEAVHAQFEPEVEAGFLARIPGAFAYPVRGAGVLIVIVGIVMFALLKWGAACIQFRTVRMVIFGLVLDIFAGGYLFTYLQSIVHATTAEERELPDLPGIGNFAEDVVVPFFRLLGLVLLSFAPAAGLGIWAVAAHQSSAAIAAWAALGLGCIYFPMAFLAVAIHDSVAAANPLLVIPSILKAPLQYGIVLIGLVAVLGVQYGGWLLVQRILPEGIITQSMPQLFGVLVSGAFLSFLTLYLLVVTIHLLGLIYVTRKEQLGWLRR